MFIWIVEFGGRPGHGQPGKRLRRGRSGGAGAGKGFDMNIAVIGAGHVGGTLGSRLAQAGHMIYFGVRNHEGQHLKDVLALSGRNGMALAVPEATAKASVVILATPWEATRGAVISAGKLAGKILIDCTNPIAPDLAA